MKEIEKATTVPDLASAGVRSPAGELGNEARAEFGRAAVDLGTPDRGQNDDRTDAVDTIANVMHWLRGLDLAPRACLDAAARHFEAEVDTVEKQAIRILTEVGIPAYLEHTGGGVWVAEARSTTIPDRYVWVTDSEGDEAGPFLVGVYPSDDIEVEAIDSLSGACDPEQLLDRVRRGLSEPA